MCGAPRIALIHAVAVAMPPVEAAFREHWPQAERVNILEDSLSPDREAAGMLTAELSRRIAALADYAAQSGARGILFTCSAFGTAIEGARAKLSIPVLKPNEAMFEEALARAMRVGMLATFEPSIASMEEEFRALAAERNRQARLESLWVDGAMAALRAGDGETHDRLLAQAAPRLAHCEVILLAHFSTARARQAVAEALGRPVLTSPASAVGRLRNLLA
jgi:Asp/Glu/hydantoin racemase